MAPTSTLLLSTFSTLLLLISLIAHIASAVDIEFFYTPWEEGGPASGSIIAHNVVSAQCYGGPPPTEYYHIQFRGLLYNHWAQPFRENGATCVAPDGGSFGPGTYDYYQGSADSGPYLGSGMAITCPERGPAHWFVASACEERKRSLDAIGDWTESAEMPQKRSAEPAGCIVPDTLVWNGTQYTGGDVEGEKWVDAKGKELDQPSWQAYLGKIKKRGVGRSFQA
ncbi:hypothetical protein MMC21_003697 [Puttea exsequens]|nr:hypothetical protein [Puttea exsequens]